MAWGVPKLGTVVTQNGGAITLVEPAGVAQNDLMIACIAYRDGGVNALVTVAAGWSQVATTQNSGDTDNTNGIASGAMFYIVRGASAPGLSFGRISGDVAYGRIISYSGGATSSVLDTGSSNTLGSASVTVTTGTITTAEAGELLVAMVACGDNLTTSAFDAATDPTTASGATDTTTVPTDGTWIERSDSGTATGADTALAIADAIRATAGATGTVQATVSTAARHVMFVGAFKLASTAKILTADAGSYALTGTAATLKRGLKVVAAAGSYALSGSAATLRKKITLAAAAGAYAITGSAATLKRTLKVVADAGSYTLAGSAATLRKNIPLAAAAGSYALSGSAVTFRRGLRVIADVGTFTLSGAAATLRKNYSMPASSGSYSLTGSDATLIHNVLSNKVLVVDAGSYALTGTAATLKHNSRLEAVAGSLVISGAAVTLRRAVTLVLDPAAFVVTGAPVGMTFARKLAANTGIYTISGATIDLIYSGPVVGGAGSEYRRFAMNTARRG